jgi:hypothetical protein
MFKESNSVATGGAEASWKPLEIPLVVRELAGNSNALLELYRWFADHPEREKVEAEILNEKIARLANEGVTIQDGQGLLHQLRISNETARHLQDFEIETHPHPRVPQILSDGIRHVLEAGKIPQREVVQDGTYFRNHAVFEGKDAPFERGGICGHEETPNRAIIRHDAEHSCGDTLLAINHNSKSLSILLADAVGHGEAGRPIQEFLQLFLREWRVIHPQEPLERSLEAFEKYADSIPLYNNDTLQYEYALLNFKRNQESDKFLVSIHQSGNFSLIITKNINGSFEFVSSETICNSVPLRFMPPDFSTPYQKELGMDFSVITASDGIENVEMPDGTLLSDKIPEILNQIAEKNPLISAEEFGKIFYDTLQEIHTHTDSSPTDDVTLLLITGSELDKQLAK